MDFCKVRNVSSPFDASSHLMETLVVQEFNARTAHMTPVYIELPPALGHLRQLLTVNLRRAHPSRRG